MPPIPAEALIGLRAGLAAMPPRDPARQAEVARSAALFGVTTSTMYRALKRPHQPKALRRADHGRPRDGAPAFINYMSADVEGAEYEALRTFPFDGYRIGALTIEHNDIRDRRKAIRHLLESHGYRLERAILDQDWYVLDDVQSAGRRAE